jgi:hypothetical protein
MTRRPASRRPPKLEDPAKDRTARATRKPSVGDQLKAAHVAGRSLRYGREEVVASMRRLAEGDGRVRWGLASFPGLQDGEVESAVGAVFGWRGDGTRARIAPKQTHTAFTAALDRISEVARRGGRVAFATARPASMLPLYRTLAAMVADDGAQVLEAAESGPVDNAGRRLWWIDGVATLTDRAGLLSDDSPPAADELLFCLPLPDLVVADHGYAGTALARGLEVVAFADLDAVAFAVAERRGMAVRVVPLDQERPPGAYAPLLDLVRTRSAAPGLGLEALPEVDEGRESEVRASNGSIGAGPEG